MNIYCMYPSHYSKFLHKTNLNLIIRPPAEAAELQKTISNSFFEDVGCSQTASKFKQMSEVVSYFQNDQDWMT